MAFLTKVKIQDSSGDAIENGQQTMANSVPVVIASNQTSVSTTNTNAAGASAVNIQDGGNSITVDGTVISNQGTAAATAGAWPAKITDGTDIATVTAAGELNVLATAQPGVDIGDVTVNNAAGASAVNIQDGGNSITVDGTVAVSSQIPGTGATNLGKAEDAAHTSGDTGVMALAVRNDAGGSLAGADGDYIPLTTDSSGNLRVTGGGGGQQFAEDTAHTSGDLGTMALAVRNDAGTPLAGTTGDYIPLTTDSTGALRVTGSSGGTSMVDDTAFTPAVTSITPAGAVFDDTAPDSVDEGDGGALRMSGNRNLYTQIRDAAGNERGTNVTVANELSVLATAQPGVDIGDVTVNNAAGASAVNIQDGGNSITVDGTVTSNIGTTGGLALDATLTGGTQQTKITDGTDIAQVTAAGALLVDGSATTQPVSGTVAVSSVTTSVTPGTSAAHLGKAEDAVHASGDTGVMSLGVRNDTNATSTSTDGDYSAIAVDLAGNQRVVGNISDNGVDAGAPVKVGAVYNLVQPTYASGDRADLQADSNGNLRVTLQSTIAGEDLTNQVLGVQVKPLAATTYAYTQFQNFGASANVNVKASLGNVFSLMVKNLNASERFLQLHNSAGTVAGGAIPQVSIPVPTNGTVILGTDFFGQGGESFSSGINMAFSTTQGTFTTGAAADVFCHIRYK